MEQNQQRVINIIKTQLSIDNLKMQHKLQTVLGDTNDIEETVSQVDKLLYDLVINEAKMAKFISLVTPPPPPAPAEMPDMSEMPEAPVFDDEVKN